MTTQHTPGSWRAVVRSNQTGVRFVGVDMAPRARSWEPRTNSVMTEQDAADARLIAAAPELLAALKKWAEFSRANYPAHEIEWMPETIAAIAKAEGWA